MIELALLVLFLILIYTSIIITGDYLYLHIRSKILQYIIPVILIPLLPIFYAYSISYADKLQNFISLKVSILLLNAFQSLIKLNTDSSFESNFTNLSVIGILLTYVTAFFTFIGGGFWEHANKNGSRDLRFKFNSYTESDGKVVAGRILITPLLILIFCIVRFLFEMYSSKH